MVRGGRGDVDKFLERALHTLIATACASTLECLYSSCLSGSFAVIDILCMYVYIYIYLGNKEI